MIDFDFIRTYVVKGLKDYLKMPVIRSNQAEKLPSYPYLSYTITSLSSSNNGTYGVYEDGSVRKPITQGWSLTVQTDDAIKAMEIALKVKDWFEHVGIPYLDKQEIVIQSVSGITNRDNLLTIEYEYRYGLDVVLWLLNETGSNEEETGVIETVVIDENSIEPSATLEELNKKLEDRLSGEVS